MSSSIDLSLYPRLHETMADRFGTVVFKLLPDIADALLTHAADGLDTNVAAKLTDTARRLRKKPPCGPRSPLRTSWAWT